jgi:dolichyl-phosphate-mannose-protein mannosyltransferase
MHLGAQALKTWMITGLVGVCATIIFLQGITAPTWIFDEPKYVYPAREILAGTQDSCPDGPPLGKLIVAAGIRTLGDNHLGWRAASALFGGFTLAGIFLLAQMLLNDTALAATAAALAFLNNFLFIMSRTAMMDIFFFAFALWSVVTFIAAVWVPGLGAAKRRLLLICTGVLLGLSAACKWNAVDELCVFAVIGAGALFLSSRTKNPEVTSVAANLREAGVPWFAGTLLVLPLIAYALAFWPYCKMLHLPFTWAEFKALNVYIWRFHLAVVGNPGNTLAWYKWPFQIKPSLLFSFLVGNWYVMWGGLIALAFCIVRFGRNLPETLIVLLYFANYLQWAVTPQQCLYYYYYFPAAMFLGMAIPVALYRLPGRLFGVRLNVVSVIPALFVFLFCLGQMAHLPPPYDCILGCWP